MLAVGTWDGKITLVEATTGRVRWAVQSYPGYQNRSVRCVAISPDGNFVASVCVSEEHWKLWDAASGVVCVTGARHDGTGACVCRVKEGGEKTSLDAGCPVQAHTSGVRVVAFSPCGQKLATGGDDRAVILWNAQTGKAEEVMKGHTRKVSAVCFSADGARLASGGWDKSIRVWDAASGAMLRALEHGSCVECLHFSPTDSRKLVSTGNTYTAKQWNVDTGERIGVVEGSKFALFSPDGRTIATAGGLGKREVLFFDAETGASRLRLLSHAQNVSSAAWSVGGSMLATGSRYDGIYKVWDVSTGALLIKTKIRSSIESVSCGRDWVLDTQRAVAVAFTMGQHPRIGAGSLVLNLEEGVVQMILDRVA